MKGSNKYINGCATYIIYYEQHNVNQIRTESNFLERKCDISVYYIPRQMTICFNEIEHEWVYYIRCKSVFKYESNNSNISSMYYKLETSSK